jgi:Flp pilus assembly protein TadB
VTVINEALLASADDWERDAAQHHHLMKCLIVLSIAAGGINAVIVIRAASIWASIFTGIVFGWLIGMSMTHRRRARRARQQAARLWGLARKGHFN